MPKRFENIERSKVNLSDFEEFKKYSKDYVHKTEIETMYSIVLPAVDKVKRESMLS